jgi:hypothetical protein
LKAPKPPCVTLPAWLKENLGKDCLAPLTGTDAKALAAAVQIVECYAYAPSTATVHAFAAIVLTMQEKTQELAYHAIAHVMDWGDRSELWHRAGLPTFTPRKCAFEPGGSMR